jgi:hypothetical protein
VPFTPFHLGPGAAFKAIGGGRFSFMVFGGSQVLTDIEPGIRMLSGDTVLHGASHTIVGAFLIGTISALIGKPISEFVLRMIRMPYANLTWTASATGAFAGTYSHLILDAILHSDVMPWSPLSDSNGILGLISPASLHITCLVLGAVGGVVVLVRYNAGRDS